jgi:hypothetical protein
MAIGRSLSNGTTSSPTLRVHADPARSICERLQASDTQRRSIPVRTRRSKSRAAHPTLQLCLPIGRRPSRRNPTHASTARDCPKASRLATLNSLATRRKSPLPGAYYRLMPHLAHTGGDYSADVDHYCSAVDVARAMVRHPADDRYRMRAFCELIRGAQELGAEAMQLIADEPPLIGDRRFDALLGAQRNISLLVSDSQHRFGPGTRVGFLSHSGGCPICRRGVPTRVAGHPLHSSGGESG